MGLRRGVVLFREGEWIEGNEREGEGMFELCAWAGGKEATEGFWDRGGVVFVRQFLKILCWEDNGLSAMTQARTRIEIPYPTTISLVSHMQTYNNVEGNITSMQNADY